MSNAGQGISADGFLAVVWVLAGISTVLLFGRLLVRGVLLKSFHADDAFSALAWVSMLIAIILATISTPLNYKSSSILIGETPAPSAEEVENITITLRRWNIGAETFFWVGLYCVKLSFMFLYRLIFFQYRLVWSLVTVYIILSFGACLIGVYGQCGSASNLFSYEQCMTSYVAILDGKIIWIDFVLNVTTDLAIFIFPLPMIWRLNMHTKQKLAVTAICSLALITIAFEVARTVKLYTEDFTLTGLYSYLELLVSVLVSMLPSYRFLVSPADKDREYRRLLWDRLTMRSNLSCSSAYSMNNMRRGQANQSQQAINEQATPDGLDHPSPAVLKKEPTFGDA